MNPLKIPNKVRNLLSKALLVPLPDDVREWVADALVTGVLPIRRVTDRSCGPNVAFPDGYDSAYWITDALRSLQYRVHYTRNEHPWRSQSVRDGIASLNTVLYIYGQQQKSS